MNETDHTEDIRLIKGAARSDAASVAHIVKSHGSMVYNTCLRILRDPTEAEDASQAVFLVFLKKCSKLGRKTVLAGWLYRTAEFVSKRHLRALVRRRKHESAFAEKARVVMEDIAMVSGNTHTIDWNSISPELDSALASLPARFRDVIVLHYFEERPCADVADTLSVPESTVMTWLDRARKKLGKKLRSKGLSIAPAVLGGLLAENAQAAAMPAGLASSVEAAAGLTAGGIEAVAASGNAVHIAQGALRMMTLAKIKLATCVLAAVTALGAATPAVVGAFSGESGESCAAAPAPVPPVAWKTPELPAFPGAEGFGSITAGGRGGRVFKVTNLNPSGPGSLQWACGQKGPRIVVFTVSGVIKPPCTSKGKNWLSIKDDNITIAGQTAPGAGITIDGMLSTKRGMRNRRKDEYACDVILRFLRFRPTCTGGGRNSNLRGLELFNAKRMILDHVSVSWSTDDLVALGCNPGATELTFQWMAIEESGIHLEGGDEPHNFAMHTTVYTDEKGKRRPSPMSVHHTLFAHHHDRVPCVDGTTPFDYRNNVIYNAGSSGTYDPSPRYTDSSFMNSVGNYAKPGPGSIMGVRAWKPPCTVCWSGVIALGKRGRYYYAGNYHGERGGYTEPWRHAPAWGRKRVTAQPFPAAPIRTQTADEAYELVCASAGCLPRDAVSRRTIAEVETFTGSWGRHGSPGGLMEGLTPEKAPGDTDNDGMPDAWEKARGLDPADPKDNNKIVPAGASPGDRHKGYTWIEYYINERADELVARALTEYRLNTEPPKPWKEPANELPPGATPHKSLEDMVAAIREQTEDKGYRTGSAWYAVQQLSRMGEKGKSAVPGLVKILEESNIPRTVSFAAWGLGAIGPAAKDAVPALIKVLGKQYSDPPGAYKAFRVHGFTLWALGRIGPAAKDAVPVLGEFVRSKGNPHSHPPATWALSQMGPAAEAAMPELLGGLASKSSAVRHHAAATLANVGSPAVPGLTKVAGRQRPRRPRAARAAVRALRRIGPEAKPALPVLIKLMQDADATSRIEAAQALAAIAPADAGVISALGEALSDKEYGVRVSAAEALGECGVKAAGAVPSLEKALSDQKREVKRAAALALGRIGQTALPVLKKAVTGKDAYVRKFAARALSGAGAGAVPVLIKALSDENAEVRREAVWALGRIGKSAGSAAPVLEKCIKEDNDFVVRVAAREVLKRIK